MAHNHKSERVEGMCTVQNFARKIAQNREVKRLVKDEDVKLAKRDFRNVISSFLH